MAVGDRELLNTYKEFCDKLPIEYRDIVTEYFKLVRQSTLLEKDLESISAIWEKAERDEKLSYWLEEVDFILCDFNDSDSQCENDQEEYREEKDEEMQCFLSEHLKILTTQKIKEREWESKHEKQDQQVGVESTILLCPDGSGFKRLTPDEYRNGETLTQWSERKCNQCGRSYSEHRQQSIPNETIDFDIIDFDV